MDDPSPIDRLLEQVRERLNAEHAPSVERVARLREAVDAYARAVAGDQAAALARRVGVQAAAVGDPAEAARNLLALVRQLPELADGAPREAPREPTAKPSPPVVEVSPAAPSGRPEVAALLADFQRIPFASMSDDLFAAYAEEFAARARMLQDKAPSGRAEDLDLLIRKLTAQVHGRELSGIYGLSRRHRGPWGPRLERARARRLELEATAVKAG